ncbi:hypothetical protein ACFSKL_06940 [Belliella marina]|uniref:Bacterial toxin 23 domain-containing protein n=1 Tax=Belliella marina TaxID=1644146 RepID=A0ABW4VIL1_9BACT
MQGSSVMMVDPDGELAFLATVGIAAAIGGAGYTANVAFSKGGFDNWSWNQFGKSAGMGAVSGVVTAGIGSRMGPVGSQGFAGEIERAMMHGQANMMVGSAFGQTPSLSPFAAGSIGSLVGSAAHRLGPVGQIAGSILAGGLGAELTGGGFWRGAAVGATVAGFNHLAHRLQNDPWETTGEYEKSGKLVGIHRVIRQQNGYTTYSNKTGGFFTLGSDGNDVGQQNGMLSYFPGGKNFSNSHMGEDIRSFFNFIDKVVQANNKYGRTDPSGIYTLPLPSDPDGFSGRPFYFIPFVPKLYK